MKKEKLITIPNIITFFRLLLIPFFILFLVYNKTEIAILLFAAIALSDMLDGLSARIMKQKTKMGALFDLTTDWLVLVSALITGLFIRKYIPIKVIILLLVSAIINLIVKGIYMKKGKKIAPTIIGKITVGFGYITIITLLINFAYKDIFLFIIIILAYATTLTHIVRYVKLFIR